MDVSEIKDEASLRAWLEGLPAQIGEDEARRWGLILAARANLRSLAIAFDWCRTPKTAFVDETALPFIRPVFSFAALSYALSEELEDAAYYASASYNDTFLADASDIDAPGNLGHYTRGSAFDVVEAVGWSVSDIAGYYIPTNPHYKLLDEEMAWEQVRADCMLLSNGVEPHSTSLFSPRSLIQYAWQEIRQSISILFENAGFWIDWYDKALNGEPQDWDLLTKVALIPSEDWDKGADHVNALIARIVEQHRLAGEARSLKAEIGALRAELELLKHRGHNSPPELVDETKTALRQTTIIWAALDEAETELEKQEPDVSVLKRVVQTIVDATKAFASYCVNLGDQFAQSAAQEAGKLAGKAAVIAVSGTILAQNDQIQAFARALARFVASFGG